MNLGAFVNHVFNDLTFDEMLDFLTYHQVDAVELATGNYPGDRFVPLNELLVDATKRRAFINEIERRGLFISAFACHGNPLSPNVELARQHHETIIKTIELAGKLGVPFVTGFSGMPGPPDHSMYPNFPTAPWPPEYQEIYEWQWENRVIPYWREVGRFAAAHGVKLAIEPHGCFSVHSPYTLLKLRNAVGDVIGVNIDAAHLWWQGINVIEAIRIFGDQEALYHFSSKDIAFNSRNLNLYGVLDMQPFSDVKNRSWTFRTIGYGQSLKTWADMISALKANQYDYVVNIEQDDYLIDGLVGFQKAARSLKKLLL